MSGDDLDALPLEEETAPPPSSGRPSPGWLPFVAVALVAFVVGFVAGWQGRDEDESVMASGFISQCPTAATGVAVVHFARLRSEEVVEVQFPLQLDGSYLSVPASTARVAKGQRVSERGFRPVDGELLVFIPSVYQIERLRRARLVGPEGPLAELRLRELPCEGSGP